MKKGRRMRKVSIEEDQLGTSSESFLSRTPVLVDFDKIPLKKDERGAFYFLQHPKNGNYLKVHEKILQVVLLCDGKRTVREIVQKASSTTDLQEEQIVKIIEMLAKNKFFRNVECPRGSTRTDVLTVEKKIVGSNSPSLQHFYETFSFLTTPYAKLFLLSFCGLGISLFLWQLPSIFRDATKFTRFERTRSPMMLLPFFLLIMYVLAFLHEFAHAGAYYYQSGEVEEMGIAFHFFMPFLYTKTPKTRSMERKGALKVFLAGPLVNLLATALFTYLYLGGGEWRMLWALSAYGSALSSLMTLLPFLKGDGYYILQRLSKFPNLMGHSMDNLKQIGKLLIGKASPKEYKNYLSMYSAREKQLLFAYTILFPIFVIFLVSLYLIQAFAFRMIEIIALTPQVLFKRAPNPQVFILWIVYMIGLLFTVLGLMATIYMKFSSREDKEDKKLLAQEATQIE